MENVLKTCMYRVKSDLRGRLIVPYQANGVLWMLRREIAADVAAPGARVYRGGLLCDDMGLGKTIQTIATMIGNPQPSTLIVVPKAVVVQWVEAVRRFMGAEPHVITSGMKKTGLGDVRADDLRDHKIVITTYPTVAALEDAAAKRDAKNPFHEVVFSRIVCDEVHVIKNHGSKIFSLITAIDARIRWGLTGTPILRNLRDLANLLVYVGMVPLTKSALLSMRSTYVLRRTKEDVARVTERLRLPPLDIRLVSTPFRTAEERALYDDIREEGRLRLAALHAAGAGERDESNTHFHVLEAILRLRQCVVNPQVLLDGLDRKARAASGEASEPSRRRGDRANGASEATRANGASEATRANGASETTERGPSDRASAASDRASAASDRASAASEGPPTWTHGFTKLELLMELIAEHKTSGEKTLIFCHWIGEMDAIQDRLRTVHGLESVRLDGTLSEFERARVIDEFETSTTVDFLVVQIDCGGVGLNLQAATRVYINSLHWNAANELQAIGRTHRTGQTQKVVVTRLIIEDTIDEYIIQKQGGKLKIAAEAFDDPRFVTKLNDAKGETHKLTRKDLAKIFSVS